MATDEALAEIAWSQLLYRAYRDSMPQEVRATRDFFVVRGKWDVVAAGTLDWAAVGPDYPIGLRLAVTDELRGGLATDFASVGPFYCSIPKQNSHAGKIA